MIDKVFIILFVSIVFEWSYDGETWHKLPRILKWIVSANKYSIILKEGDFKTVYNLINEIGAEPVYHSIFREAWEQRSSNPISSMIMVVTAIEVFAKQLIEKTVPDAEWLIFNIQSPPIFKLFQDYIPNLEIDNDIQGVKILPPKEMISDLRNWVNKRKWDSAQRKESKKRQRIKGNSIIR